MATFSGIFYALMVTSLKSVNVIYTYELLLRYNIKTINTVQKDQHAVLTVMIVEKQKQMP